MLLRGQSVSVCSYHSSPARLMVPLLRPQPHWLPPMVASEAERGQLSQDTARLLVKVEHTLRDAGWGSDTQIRRLDQALAARDRERMGYLCTEDVSLSVVLHILTYVPLQHCIANASTVEPLCRGHHWDPVGCPVYRGVPNSEVDLYTALCGLDCRQCLHLKGALYSECL